MNLLDRLRTELALSYLFISHDMAVIRQLSDQIGVMYAGRFVERGPWDAVMSAPLHPYTRALLAAVPAPQPDGSLLAGAEAAPAEPVAAEPGEAAAGPPGAAGDAASGGPQPVPSRAARTRRGARCGSASA